MNFILYCIFFGGSYFYHEIQIGALSPTAALDSLVRAQLPARINDGFFTQISQILFKI